MQHLRYKTEQTAAHYVAHALDNEAQEAFELHMMSCDECVGDVEVFRALKRHLPEAANEQSSGLPPASAEPSVDTRRSSRALPPLRLAASLGGVALLGAAAGWYGHAARSPAEFIEKGAVVFYNLPATTRDVACTPLNLSAAASLVLLRIPGAVPAATIEAADSTGRPLEPGQYKVRVQDDGSWLVQFGATRLRNEDISLRIRQSDGESQSLGCIVGASAAH